MLPSSSGAHLRRRLGITTVASSPTFYGRCGVGIPILQQPQHQRQQQLQPQPPSSSTTIRHYHGTAKTEIVPLILATVVVGGGYYSYRAWQRMNTEWEDYHWALQEYERQQLKNTAAAATTSNNTLSLQSMAVDLGTVFTKLATTHPTLQLAISREGDRAFFNGVVYDNPQGNEKDNNKVVTCRGRTALERFYFAPHHSSSSSTTTTTPACPVTLPSLAVLSLLGADADATQFNQAQQLVTHVLQPALTEVLDRTTTTTTNTAIRQVITVPSSFCSHVDLYQNVFAGIQLFSDTSSSFAMVPEPVAAVWGAQFHDILPAGTNTTTTSRHERPKKPTTLVVDVGGYTTQVAVVRDDRVVHATTIPFGGETVVEQLVEWLVREQQHQSQPDDNAAHPLSNDTRALALLQMQARHAVTELSTQTRVHVHVPYVFANPQQHHLEARVARSVLEQTVQTHVIPSLVGSLIRDSASEQPQLSPHLPIPHDFTSLWTSVVTQVLEQSALLPTALDHVLLVGGGSKMPLMHATLGEALQQLLGSTTTKLFPTIDPALRAELVVLGAATLLPSCDYSFEEGLIVVRAPSS